GIPFGGEFAIARAINNAGQVVGYVGTTHLLPDGSNAIAAFLWTPNTPNGSIGHFDRLPALGGLQSAAFDINNHGLVSGEATEEDEIFHPVLWQTAGRIQVQPLSDVDATTSRANEAGQAIGTGFDDTTFGFLWELGEFFDLSDAVPNHPFIAANSLNFEEVIAGAVTIDE